MSEQEFNKLMYATRVMDSETLYYQQAAEWEAKRDTLIVQLTDIPALIKECQVRRRAPCPSNPQITLVDRIPEIRLANACEATAHCLYSIAEIASNFANKASRGELPSSFNQLRKRCEAVPSLAVALALGDLQWYRKVRELRTEWTHFSSVYIIDNPEGPTSLCVRSYRRPNDRIEFQGPSFSCTLDEFIVRDRDRGSGYPLAPPTPPCVRGRIRRFGGLS